MKRESYYWCWKNNLLKFFIENQYFSSRRRLATDEIFTASLFKIYSFKISKEILIIEIIFIAVSNFPNTHSSRFMSPKAAD